MTQTASLLPDTVPEMPAVNATTPALTVRSFGLTDRGQVRPSNEDHFLIAELARTLWVHQSGDRLAVRLRDKNNHLRKEFAGLSWYPVSEAYRVDGQFVPYDTPKTMQIPNILGDVDSMTSPGTASFSIGGQRMQMVAISDPDHPNELWFIFRDLTTGKETDPAARFLYTPLPVSGKLTLDFNRAQNPPCAYNAFATCPLPPQENRMHVRVEAGEKIYGPRP